MPEFFMKYKRPDQENGVAMSLQALRIKFDALVDEIWEEGDANIGEFQVQLPCSLDGVAMTNPEVAAYNEGFAEGLRWSGASLGDAWYLGTVRVREQRGGAVHTQHRTPAATPLQMRITTHAASVIDWSYESVTLPELIRKIAFANDTYIDDDGNTQFRHHYRVAGGARVDGKAMTAAERAEYSGAFTAEIRRVGNLTYARMVALARLRAFRKDGERRHYF